MQRYFVKEKNNEKQGTEEYLIDMFGSELVEMEG